MVGAIGPYNYYYNAAYFGEIWSKLHHTVRIKFIHLQLALCQGLLKKHC